MPLDLASLPTRLRFTKELRQNPQLSGFAWLQEAGHYCGMIERPFGRRKSDGLPALSIDAEGCEEVRRVDCFTPLEVARAPREHLRAWSGCRAETSIENPIGKFNGQAR